MTTSATRFEPLPQPSDSEGAVRRVGVELEFAGLAPGDAARIVARVCGGSVEDAGPEACIVKDTRIGEVKVYLDTALREKATNRLAELGLEMSRAIVPVEIVTAPVAPEDLPLLEELRAALREAGAQGSRDGLLFGFGLHLNVQLARPDGSDIARVTLAYALLEEWLRRDDPMDISRRFLPFTDRYPASFVSALAEAGPEMERDAFIRLYLSETPTRNRGLDVLPILLHLAPEMVEQVLGPDHSVSARPAWHYRLPDCRIDEAGWTLAGEWNRWVRVESLAADADLLDRLARAWLDHAEQPLSTRGAWAARVNDLLEKPEA